MTLPGDGIALRLDDPGDSTIRYDASDDRAAMTALMTPGGAGLAARAGRRPGALTVSIGGSPEAVTVPAHSGIITDPDGGAYLYAFPNAVSKDLDARPGAGTSRIDLVVAHIYDADVHPADTSLRELDLEVVTGNAGAVPVVPTQPDGTVLVAMLSVPASGAISVNVNGPRTVAVGGILPVASQAERDALTAYDGLVVYREDTDAYEGHANGGWQSMVAGAWTTYVPTLSGWTLGNGSMVARYTQVGKTVHWEVQIVWGSTTTADTTLKLGLPVAAPIGRLPVGMASITDVSTSSRPFYFGVVCVNSGTDVIILLNVNNALVTQVDPMTWAAGDILSVSGTYEAA